MTKAKDVLIGAKAQKVITDLREQLRDALEAVTWYRRRCKALEQWLAWYRLGIRPSDKLWTELNRTQEKVQKLEEDHDERG